MPADPTPTETGARLDAAAGVLRAGVHLYQVMGTPLYSTLCAHGASDPDIVALVSRGREGAAAMHLFSAVHYLLLRDPGDSLSRYFATLTPDPAAPEDAFPSSSASAESTARNFCSCSIRARCRRPSPNVAERCCPCCRAWQMKRGSR